jgi:hypothetical protein
LGDVSRLFRPAASGEAAMTGPPPGPTPPGPAPPRAPRTNGARLSPAHQLTIIDFDTTGGEALLLRGLGHHDWVTRNLPILRRLYPEPPIDYSLPPALMLVAPQFSAPLKRAARQITRPTIKWVTYHAHESSAGLGVFFERLEGD